MPDPNSSPPAISFSNVRLTLGGIDIYESLCFTVAPQEFVCLLGPSGCGKSSALRLIGDLLPWQHGDVRVEDLAPAIDGLNGGEQIGCGGIACLHGGIGGHGVLR